MRVLSGAIGTFNTCVSLLHEPSFVSLIPFKDTVEGLEVTFATSLDEYDSTGPSFVTSGGFTSFVVIDT